MDIQDLQTYEVRLEVDDTYVDIQLDGNASFLAWVDSARIAYLSINTFELGGLRHPYFVRHRASRLARHALRHFDQSEQVIGLMFDWLRPKSTLLTDRSDNYTAYVQARNTLMAQSSMEYETAKRQAALQSWTIQKIGLPLQFTEIVDVEEKGVPATPLQVSGIAYRRT